MHEFRGNTVVINGQPDDRFQPAHLSFFCAQFPLPYRRRWDLARRDPRWLAAEISLGQLAAGPRCHRQADRRARPSRPLS